MPKVKQALSITERMEHRVDEIGLIIKPVFESGAAKAAETINKIDANDIGKEVKETAKSVIDKASDAALKRLIPDRTPQNE